MFFPTKIQTTFLHLAYAGMCHVVNLGGCKYKISVNSKFTTCQMSSNNLIALKIYYTKHKRLLGVKTSTCTPAVYCELGRIQLLLTRTLRITRYWFYFFSSQNCLINSIYEHDLKTMLSSLKVFVKNTLL